MKIEEIEKTVKAPGALRRPIKGKKFAGKFEKFIEHPGDKKFFVSCFEERDGIYYIRDNLTKDNVKKLKVLLKAVKANRKGSVKVVPILFAASVVAALVVFFTIFANPILGNLLEKGLEAAFEAKADVRGFRLSLIKFEISVNHIVVANRDKPMTNLFELGKTGIKLKPAAVLRGKIYIEWIKAQTILFGTERKVSGAIPGKPPKHKKEKPPKPDAPPLIDLKKFDATALLNSEFDKLKTPKLYDLAINTYNETSDKWRKQADESAANVKKIQAEASDVLGIDVNNIRDIEEAKNAVEKITKMIDTVQTTSGDVQRIVNGLEADLNTAKSLEADARSSLTDDLNRLKSYIDLGSGEAFSALEPYIRDMLSDTAEQYIDYGLTALNVLEQLKGYSSVKKPPKAKKEKKVVFKGRDIHFPVVSYPTFYLGQAASDFTLDSWNWSFDLKNVSSDPDFTNHHPDANGPVTLALGLDERGAGADSLYRNVGFKGNADFRTNAEEKFGAFVTGKNFPLNIAGQLSGIGINGFSGNTEFSVNMTGFKGGSVNAGGEIIVSRAEILEPKGTIAQAVGDAVKEAGNVSLGIQYADDRLSVSTNIMDLIGRALRQIVETYAKKAAADLEAALRKKIDEYIDGRFVSKEQVEALLKIAKGDMAAIEQTKEALTKKANELQRTGEQQIRQVTDDAERKAQEMKEEAERKAKEEAQKKTEEAAKSLLPGLPGRR